MAGYSAGCNGYLCYFVCYLETGDINRIQTGVDHYHAVAETGELDAFYRRGEVPTSDSTGVCLSNSTESISLLPYCGETIGMVLREQA